MERIKGSEGVRGSTKTSFRRNEREGFGKGQWGFKINFGPAQEQQGPFSEMSPLIPRDYLDWESHKHELPSQ
jgi:hypothetical protein